MALSSFIWLVLYTVLVLAAYAVVKRCVHCTVYVMSNQQCVLRQHGTWPQCKNICSSKALNCECFMRYGSCRLIGALVSALVRSNRFKLTVTSVGFLMIKGINLQLSKVPSCSTL